MGGAPPHALRRTIRYGDAWLPMARDPESLAPAIGQLRDLADEAGRPMPGVSAFTGLPLGDPPRAAARARAFAEVGVDHLICGTRYADADEYRRGIDALAEKVRPALESA